MDDYFQIICTRTQRSAQCSGEVQGLYTIKNSSIIYHPLGQDWLISALCRESGNGTNQFKEELEIRPTFCFQPLVLPHNLI